MVAQPTATKPLVVSRVRGDRLHGAGMQKLNRSREEAPINPDLRCRLERETAGQAPVPYTRDTPTSVSMVAGVHDHRAPSGSRPDIAAGHRACTMQLSRRSTTQCRRFHVLKSRETPPGIPCPVATFGVRARRSFASAGERRRRVALPPGRDWGRRYRFGRLCGAQRLGRRQAGGPHRRVEAGDGADN